MELTTDSALFDVLNRWLAEWFDDSNHSVGRKAPVHFPKANRAFGHRRQAQPLCNFDAGVDAEIRVVMLPPPEITDTNDGVISVGKSILLNFWISAKRPGKGASERLAENIAKPLVALLTTSKCHHFLTESGIRIEQPRSSATIAGAEYAKRLVSCVAQLSQPIQFDDSVWTLSGAQERSTNRPRAPIEQKTFDVKPGFEKAHEEWLKQGCKRFLPRDYCATRYWNLVRQAVLKRDSSKCFRCGDVATQVHHLHYDFKGEDHLHPESLVSICWPCHNLVEYARNAEALISKMEGRVSLFGPTYIFERILKYRDDLGELRSRFGAKLPYGTIKDRNAIGFRIPKGEKVYHEMAVKEVSSWVETDTEKQKKVSSMLQHEIENCRAFVSEVFRPIKDGRGFGFEPSRKRGRRSAVD